MRFIYQQWDGQEFATQDHLQQFSQFLEYVLEYGDDALESLEEMTQDSEARKLVEKWIDEGLLDKTGARFRLTPRAISSMQRKALMEVFRGLRPDAPEGHPTHHAGAGGERLEGTRRYLWGDPIHELDINETLRNAVQRAGPRVPMRLREEDFAVHLSEARATCSTVILLDMSGSMARWHRFTQAKKCAMAMYALIRQRFALDTVDVVGFATAAEMIPEHKLPLARPMLISTHAPRVNLRVPLSAIASAPRHFTNLHLGLLTARRILARRGGVNKQVFIITDGQPTAHMEGDLVHLLYPPDDETSLATLGEAIALARSGVRFSTFALIEDYFYMDWVNFVGNLTQLTRGVAFYCTSGDLTQAVMESYLSGRKQKSVL